MIRVMRSLLFSVIYTIYLVVVMLPVQALILTPLCALNPKGRPTILRWWFQAQADWVLGMACRLGGLRLELPPTLPAIPLVMVMNHQSLLDIPLGVSRLRGPYPVIPTRSRYTTWIPGISGLARLGGFPSLKQGERATRAEHAAMVAAAEAVARGERTMLIYPEGHRSKDGEIQRFMTQGLKLVFRHTHQRPVYLVVADGAHRLRSFADIAFRMAGPRVRARVLGPYTVPPERSAHDAFIDQLRSEMVATLAHMRGAPSPAEPIAHPATLVG